MLQPTQYRNRRTGQVHTGYAGIDPGFERNPGVGRMEQLGEVFVAKSSSLAADTVPAGAEVPAALDVRPTGDLRKAITRSLDAIELVHGSGNLPRIPVKRMRTGSDFGQFRSFLNGDAESIRVRAGTNALHAEMTTAHEVGHFLDFAGLPGPTYQSRLGRLPEMKQLLVVIMASATFQTISILPPSPYRSYLQHPEELFARAYAQYVAWKSGSPIMQEQLDASRVASTKNRTVASACLTKESNRRQRRRTRGEREGGDSEVVDMWISAAAGLVAWGEGPMGGIPFQRRCRHTCPLREAGL